MYLSENILYTYGQARLRANSLIRARRVVLEFVSCSQGKLRFRNLRENQKRAGKKREVYMHSEVKATGSKIIVCNTSRLVLPSARHTLVGFDRSLLLLKRLCWPILFIHPLTFKVFSHHSTASSGEFWSFGANQAASQSSRLPKSIGEKVSWASCVRSMRF